jgi:hypothetical protein
MDSLVKALVPAAAGAAAEPEKKKKRGGETRKGKTIAEKKVVDVETWAKYFSKGYQNVVLGEDGSFLVLDASLSKTDFPAALADPKKVIPHLMGDDYISVLANPSSSAELRAAAEASKARIHDGLNARIAAAKLAYSEAETTLLNIQERWKNAPDAPTRIVLAQAVAEANAAVAAAESSLRNAQAPHRYIQKYRDIPRMLVVPGSGDDRPIKNVIYRLVPAVTEAPERVITAGAKSASPANSY